MSFISYAQNFEDVMLWRALKHVDNGFYIDVGAWSPVLDSVTRAFYERDWHGINIEPNPEFNAQLQAKRPKDINLRIAISDKPGTLMMNFLSNPGLSTLDESVANGHIASGLEVHKQQVEVTTLTTVWKNHVSPEQEVHFLKVDVEGLEEAVLRGNDWTHCRPWIVVVEATMPMSQVESYSEWEDILLSADYKFAYADGLNRFYVADEHSELLPTFTYPPNVFDDFLLYAQQQADEQAQQAEAQAWQANERAQQAKAQAQLDNEQAQQAEAQVWQANEQAQQAEAQVWQANERAQQAEAQVWQANERAQQAEAQVWQANERAQQAEAQVWQANERAQSDTSAMYAIMTSSRSWRITSPARWFGHKVRLFNALIKKVTRPFIRHGIAFIDSHSRFRFRLVTISKKTGLYHLLRSIYLRLSGQPHKISFAPESMVKQQLYKIDNLTPHACQIYAELKYATKKHHEKNG